ncbi:MAG: ATP-grasp domain-containing protein [Nitrospirae bacterium]|nr:MAG: ATP-grasp domain-containing protein [Nitrospirota bacterium]
MRKKKILLLGAGREQLAAIHAAQEIGLSVLAVDGNLHAPGLRVADHGVHLDIRDTDAVTMLAKAERVDGVFCHAVEIPYIVATVAQRLGLPGLDPEVALRATHKALRYRCLAARHVPCPRYAVVETVDQARESADLLGFPVVMKPVDNAGARGVRKVSCPSEIDMSFHWALRYSSEPVVLVEEWLEGPEISTESVIVDGQIVTTGFADRNYALKQRFAPYCLEDGHTIPSCLPASDQTAVLQVVEQAIRALGITWGVAKGDLILTNKGPKVLEIAARTSGGRFCSDMVPLATGVNILKPLLLMAVGETVDLDLLSPRFHRAAAQRFVWPPPGRVVHLAGIEEAKIQPGIHDIVLDESLQIGSIIHPMTSHADRVGHVIASGETREQAVRRAEEAVQMISIETVDEVGVCLLPQTR